MGKEYIKAVVVTLLFNLMQSLSCETLGWMNHKLEPRLPGVISITSDTQMIPLAEREEELKSFLRRVKEESEKSWLETQHSKI